MILIIVGIGILGVSSTLILKEIKPSMAMFVSLATCVVISILVIVEFKDLSITIGDFMSKLSLTNGILKTAFKVVGVSYLIEFAADIADESGLQSISHKITFAGKIIIASICLPYLFELFDMVLGLL
jgi:stage III sporulation protein AD